MRTISSWQILRLARDNMLSLPLRHEWLKRTGWDPVNQERWRVHAMTSTAVIVASMAGVAVMFVVPLLLTDLQTENLRLPVFYGVVIYLAMIMVGIAWKIFIAFFLERGDMVKARESIRKHLSLFFYWTKRAPQNTYLHELTEFQALAEDVLRNIIGRQLDHLVDAPCLQAHEYAVWAEKGADLAREFSEKYRVLHDLGLVTESEEVWYAKVRQERTPSFSPDEEDSKVAADAEALETAGA